jgi:HK97 family phage major capsid protein
MPLDQFQAYALKRMEDPKPVLTPVSELGLTRREVEQYSISRAILSQIPGVKADTSFETDCHKELLRRGIEPKQNGVLIPYEVARRLTEPRGTGGDEKRDLSIVGGDTAGGYLKGTDHLGAEFIDVLRNAMVLRRAGARVLSGLRGNISIPKRTAGATSYWVAEGVAPTEGANTYAQLAMTPKNVAAYIDYTRNLLLQSNPSVDGLVNGDLALSLATAQDLAGFHGTGADGQPQGIIGTSGVGSVTATAVNLTKMLEFQTDVAGANALAANCAYITTPAVAGILRSQPQFTYGSKPLWEGNILESSDVVGFRGFATNQITAGYCIFGDYSQVVIAEWGVLELLVNPFILSSIGVIRVTAFQSVDIGLRYPGAFTASTSVTAP